VRRGDQVRDEETEMIGKNEEEERRAEKERNSESRKEGETRK